MLDGPCDVLQVTRTRDTCPGPVRIADTWDRWVLTEDTVPLSSGAMFGPDTFDVLSWQIGSISVIDALPEARPLTGWPSS